MANKRRLTGYSGMRLDWPHVRSMESSTTSDFDDVLRGLITGLSQPYLIRGMNIIIPSATANASSLVVEVADSAILHATASEAGTILAISVGTPNDVLNSANARVVGSFQPGTGTSVQPNFVALDYRRISDPNSVDNTAGWSASQKLEYQRTAPIGKILDYKYVITTSGFGGLLPLWTVGVDSNGNAAYITKATTNLFRLGTGGTNPDPQNVYGFGGLSNTQDTAMQPRQEWNGSTATAGTSNPVTVIPGSDSDAFKYGDFAISNLKEWMDAVMTRFREVSGSPFWYMQGGLLNPGANLSDLWWDTAGSVLTGAGQVSYNLVLESTPPTDGAFQAGFMDPDIIPGDSYVQGTVSGNRATVTTFNSTQLIVNSQTLSAFTFGEELDNHRLYRPIFSYWDLNNTDDSVWMLATFRRKSTTSSASTPVTSWSLVTPITGIITNVTRVDPVLLTPASSNTFLVTFSAPHSFAVKQIVRMASVGVTQLPAQLQNLYFSVASVPDNTHITVVVDDVTSQNISPTSASATIAFQVIDVITTTSHGLSVGQTVKAAGLIGAPVNPNGTWMVSEIISATKFRFRTGIITGATGGATNSSPLATIQLDSSVRQPYLPRFAITAATNIGTSVTLTAPFHNFVVGQKMLVNGLTATTNSPNGMFIVTVIAGDNVSFNVSSAPTGTIAVGSGAYARYECDTIRMSVSNAIPALYDISNALAYVISDVELFYIMGPDSLPAQPPATSDIRLDGVVAVSTVADPIIVHSMVTDPSAGAFITVTTVIPHGLNNANHINFEIFGDPTITSMATTYLNVNILVTGPTVFKIVAQTGTAFPYPNTFTNSGDVQQIFAVFPSNPHPGPIQWSSDLVIKGIIGDKYFVIPQTATVDDTSSPFANSFNVNGLTGTAYLQDGEVAFINLERSQPVSNGASFSTLGGSAVIVGVIPTDIHSAQLRAGDFVKFASEDETKWMRIAGTRDTPIITNSFSLVDDHGQPATTAQRPQASGPLVYCKGTYNQITVLPSWQVDSGADTYWIAVRRDNGSLSSKVYLKGLELFAGEVVSVNSQSASNLLIYTGAGTDAAVSPNYTAIDHTGSFQGTQVLTVAAADVPTRMVFFTSGPDYGFQIGDTFNQGFLNWTITQVITSRTVIVRESVASITLGSATFNRLNVNIEDSDNLTLAIRKEDRSIGTVSTALNRMIYDESAYIQKIVMTGASSVKSGSYVYQGTLSNPTALAWVMHGTAAVLEMVEGINHSMPGGHVSLLQGPAWVSGHTYSTGAIVTDASVNTDYRALSTTSGTTAPHLDGTHWQKLSYALINHVAGTWATGTLYQNGATTSMALDSTTFVAPTVSPGVELQLPPNRRAEVASGAISVYPSAMAYHASIDPIYCGEELMVIVNDSVRTANLDYTESFGGPKGAIQLLRALPPNSLLRARLMTSYGSALVSRASGVDLQLAYDSGSGSIVANLGKPFSVVGSSGTGSQVAGAFIGKVSINGLLNPSLAQNSITNPAIGGLFGLVNTNNPTGDQVFSIGDESNKPASSWTATQNVKTHSNHPGSAWSSFTCSDVTVGSSGTVITGSSVILAVDTAYRIKVRATARRSDGTLGVASFTCEGTFYRVTGGWALAAGYPATQILGFEGNGSAYAISFGLTGAPGYTPGQEDRVVVVAYGAGTVQWAMGIDVQAVASA